MTAPHFHTVKEVRSAIDRISHNTGPNKSDKPTGEGGGGGKNFTSGKEPGVTNTHKGEDHIAKRGA